MSAAYNSLNRKKPDKTYRSKKFPKKFKDSKAAADREDARLQRKQKKVDQKIRKLQEKLAAFSKQLAQLKEDNIVTCHKLEVSEKYVQYLELQEHVLNLEYGDFEDRENCLIFPL